MDSSSSRIFFIIVFFGSAWLILDLFYGSKLIKNAARSTAEAIKGG